MIIIKNRKIKEKEYQSNYSNIPLNYDERLSYMIDRYHLTDKKMIDILNKRYNILSNLFYYDCQVVQLFEEPEGSARPRFRIINKRNFSIEARTSQFIQVYTPNAQDDHNYMRKLTNSELVELDGLISTPCIIEYNAYYKTPSSFNISDIFLAEIGLIRPVINKPDWDNIGKKYCDMYNHNIWLDDSQVISGTVNKFYSILPRIEIKLKYLNCVYNKYQYNSIINRKDYEKNYHLEYLDNEGRIINNGNRE